MKNIVLTFIFLLSSAEQVFAQNTDEMSAGQLISCGKVATARTQLNGLMFYWKGHFQDVLGPYVNERESAGAIRTRWAPAYAIDFYAAYISYKHQFQNIGEGLLMGRDDTTEEAIVKRLGRDISLPLLQLAEPDHPSEIRSVGRRDLDNALNLFHQAHLLYTEIENAIRSYMQENCAFMF